MRLRGYALTKRKVLVALTCLATLSLILLHTNHQQTLHTADKGKAVVNKLVPPPSFRHPDNAPLERIPKSADVEEEIKSVPLNTKTRVLDKKTRNVDVDSPAIPPVEPDQTTPVQENEGPCRVLEESEDTCTVRFNKCSNEERRDSVRSAVAHAYRNYRKYAWGKDYLRPVSKDGEDGMFHLGQTVIDSIGTLHIMGFTEFTKDAEDWIKDNITLFKGHNDVSFFEIIIRYLGGLLEIFHLTGEQMFAEKARDLGVLLSQCFGNPSSIPFTRLDLGKRVCKLQGGCRKHKDCNVNTAEVSTIQLELRQLSVVTGDYIFFGMANGTSNKLLAAAPPNGVVPTHVNTYTGEFVGNEYHLGPGIDSYYEYVLKQWIQSGKKADRFKEEYNKAVFSISNMLISKTKNFTLLGRQGEFFDDEMQHLSCFVPGMLALGHYHGLPKWHLTLAQHLMRSCYYMAISQPTGLAPEAAYFDFDKLYPTNSQNVLRPEVVESLLILYRVTGDKTYRDWGWEIFRGFERSSRMCSGYSGLLDTQSTNHKYRIDRMESGFLAGTLKYLYLLFSDRTLFPLDDWLFNSHGHMLPINPTAHSGVWY